MTAHPCRECGNHQRTIDGLIERLGSKEYSNIMWMLFGVAIGTVLATWVCLA